MEPGRVDVLIAEDSYTQLAKLHALLEENGYRVQSAKNGQEAWDYLQDLCSEKDRRPSFWPNIILSDAIMPEMDGFELCRRVKEDEKFKAIPVILLTSLHDGKEALKGLYSGADNLVATPYDEAFLLARVNEMLGETQLEASPGSNELCTINIDGRKYSMTQERLRHINAIYAAYETAVKRNLMLEEANRIMQQQQCRLDEAATKIRRLEMQLADLGR